MCRLKRATNDVTNVAINNFTCISRVVKKWAGSLSLQNGSGLLVV